MLPGHQFLVRVWEIYFNKCPMVFLTESGKNLATLLPEGIALDNSMRGIWEEKLQAPCSHKKCTLPFEVHHEDGYLYRLQLEFEDCWIFRSLDTTHSATMQIHLEGKTEQCAERIFAALKQLFAPIILSDHLSDWTEEKYDQPL